MINKIGRIIPWATIEMLICSTYGIKNLRFVIDGDIDVCELPDYVIGEETE